MNGSTKHNELDNLSDCLAGIVELRVDEISDGINHIFADVRKILDDVLGDLLYKQLRLGTVLDELGDLLDIISDGGARTVLVLNLE